MARGAFPSLRNWEVLHQEVSVSKSFTNLIYPFEIARRPTIEPEVRRAILTRWSTNPREGFDSDATAARRPGRAG